MSDTCSCYGECGSHQDKCGDVATKVGLMTLFIRPFCVECAIELAKKLLDQLI